jgi:hypothetical protein
MEWYQWFCKAGFTLGVPAFVVLVLMCLLHPDGKASGKFLLYFGVTIFTGLLGIASLILSFIMYIWK